MNIFFYVFAELLLLEDRAAYFFRISDWLNVFKYGQ